MLTASEYKNLAYLRPARGEGYIFDMWERGLFVLLLAVCLFLAGLALVQVGSGPYSAVYGPASALRAQRAFLFLTLVWSALGALAIALRPLEGLREEASTSCPAQEYESPEVSPLTPALRC